MYETALEDLDAIGDQGVAGLIVRFERHRAEVVAALAARPGASLGPGEPAALSRLGRPLRGLNLAGPW
jgi:hypothetical protein